MIINVDTKIAKILKEHSSALEAIISINPKFEKLRNPVLHKLMAGRTSIGMASKIGGVSIHQFYEKLKPLGFIIESANSGVRREERPKLPAILTSTRPGLIKDLDVRPLIAADNDPLPQILEKIKSLQPGEILRLINTFEPTPLLSLLKKQGFQSYIDVVDEHTVETYFYKTDSTNLSLEEPAFNNEDWDSMVKKYNGKMTIIDVRHLEMPAPMMTILEALNSLPTGFALFVNHKKIPVFLLPELKEKEFDFRIKELAPGEVHLLIFKE